MSDKDHAQQTLMGAVTLAACHAWPIRPGPVQGGPTVEITAPDGTTRRYYVRLTETKT